MKISRECLKDLLVEGLNQSEVADICSLSRQAISQRLKYKLKKLIRSKLIYSAVVLSLEYR